MCALFLLAKKIWRWTAVNIERAHKMQSSLTVSMRKREKKTVKSGIKLI